MCRVVCPNAQFATLAAQRRERRVGAQRTLTAARERTIGHYLKRWGFTPQKPLKRAYERRLAEIQRWLDHDYPALAARAKREGAEIHWGDETSFSTSDRRRRGFAPRGHTPVLEVVARRKSVSFLSTVTDLGLVRFMVLDGPLSAAMLIAFLRRLIRSTDHTVFLILDNLNVHKAAKVRARIAAHTHEIAVFCLPASAPELNPDFFDSFPTYTTPVA